MKNLKKKLKHKLFDVVLGGLVKGLFCKGPDPFGKGSRQSPSSTIPLIVKLLAKKW